MDALQSIFAVVFIPMLSALAGFLPYSFFRRNIERRDVARMRRAMDLAADFRRIARDCNLHLSETHAAEFSRVESRWHEFLDEYERVTELPEKK